MSQNDASNVTYGEYSRFVFDNKNNLPYTAKTIESIFRNIVSHYNKYETEQAKTKNREHVLVDNYTPHQLCHSFCTILCEMV